jgi:hypothetical protein
MNVVTGRRGALRTLALTAATSAIGLASVRAESATAIVESVVVPPGSTHLDALKRRLAQAPRRRDFRTVPMILSHQEQWDHEALTHDSRIDLRPGRPGTTRISEGPGCT